MAKEKPIAQYCPNCGSKEVGINGNVITCGECDAVFKIKANAETKVVKLGLIEENTKRIEALESQLNPPDDPPADPPPAADDDDEQDDDEFKDF